MTDIQDESSKHWIRASYVPKNLRQAMTRDGRGGRESPGRY